MTRRAVMDRRRWLLVIVGLWLLTRAVITGFALNPQDYGNVVVGDVTGYEAKVDRMFQGEVPYRDVGIEYPPGSVAFMLIPGLLVGAGRGYRDAFAVEMLVVDAVGLWAAFRIAAAADRGRPRIPLAYVLGVAAVGPLLLLRFDIVPAVATLVAALLALRGRAGWAAGLLGFAAAVKLYPAVAAPVLAAGLAPAVGWRPALRRTVPPFLVGFALPVVPAVLASASGVWASLHYQTTRGVQVESLWATIVEVAHLLGLASASSTFASGAFNVVSPLANTLSPISTVMTTLLLVVTWVYIGVRAAGAGGLGGTDWPVAFALTVLVFILANRVLSPQYLLWAAAIAAATADRRPGRVAVGLLMVAGGMSQLIFPFEYFGLLSLNPSQVLLLAVRNCLLLGAGICVLRAFALGRPTEPAAMSADPFAGSLTVR